MNKVQLTPLPTALDEISKSRGAAVLKALLPPTAIRCVGREQIVAMGSIVGALNAHNENDGIVAIHLARDVYSLAIKDCVNCDTDSCPFRDNE